MKIRIAAFTFGLSLPACLLVIASQSALAKDPICALLASPFSQGELKGAELVNHIYKNLHMSAPVKSTAQSVGISIHGNPNEKVAAWFRHLAKLAGEFQSDSKKAERIRDSYLQKYILTPDQVPQSHYDLQLKIARERGEGIEEIPSHLKRQLAEAVVKDQEETLGAWLDYLFSSDTSHYPIWAKYWCFSAVTKLGAYDSESGNFGKRNRTSVAPFAEINREALAQIMQLAIATVETGNARNAYDSLSFGKMYGKALFAATQNQFTQTPQITKANSVQGRWIKYERGSDPSELVPSLQGRNTGWCTAAKETARHQLQGGDFHVFYSLDESLEPRIPRIAIRMQHDGIAEVRGVAKDQNLDGQVAGSGILEAKLKDFGREGEMYFHKNRHMKMLTAIEEKRKGQVPLTRDELRFLYEVDENIVGFGYERDPRIQELSKSGNALKAELVIAFEGKYSAEQISLTSEEAFRPGVQIHYGDLDLSKLTKVEDLVLPTHVFGKVDLRRLKSARSLTLPTVVGKDLDLSSLQKFEKLNLPEKVLGHLDLDRIESPVGLQLPKFTGGRIWLTSLKSAQGVTFQDELFGGLNLQSLDSIKGLKLPKIIHDSLDLASISSAEGLVLPEVVKGTLVLLVQSPKGLVLPKEVGGLYLQGLLSAEGIRFPEVIAGTFLLSSLITTKGLTLPKSVGEIDLRSLKSAIGLKLPDVIRSKVNLSGLETPDGLLMPKGFSGMLVVTHFPADRIPKAK